MKIKEKKEEAMVGVSWARKGFCRRNGRQARNVLGWARVAEAKAGWPGWVCWLAGGLIGWRGRSKKTGWQAVWARYLALKVPKGRYQGKWHVGDPEVAGGCSGWIEY